ncbi:MAG TPA: barstar family protein [Terrimicrobiaceae bacterium]|nr:barstar family protein [Terrimicrobiaceae bacterium]
MQIDHLVARCRQPKGTWRIRTSLTGPEASALAARLTHDGLAARVVDCEAIRSKEGLLQALAEAFAFPNHFGSNWDALLDCLSDLHWLPASGYVLIMLRARYLETADPRSFNTFLEVCQEAAARWRGRKAFFKVVVSSTEPSSREQRHRKPAAE